MKKFFLFAAAALILSSCDKEEVTTDSSFAMQASGADYSPTICSRPVKTVNGTISSNTLWDKDTIYEIDGVLRVKAELEIEPGTFIKAKPLAPGVATGVLAITKTGTIKALGTSANPIVFTSYNLLDNVAGTTASSGDFGGIVLLGEANVNNGLTTNVIEGLGDQSPVSDFYYGGTDDSDTSGTMQYVRIEFAGRILNATNGVEINGLTFGGVGDGTIIDHIQVSYGRDDAFEFFGGTVDCSNLIAFAQDDDGLDFDLGYTGTITRALVLADTNSTHSTSSSSPDSNGIELDNNPGATVTTIITKPVLVDVSIIGVSSTTGADSYENAIHIRRRGRINATNTTTTGYNTGTLWETTSNALPADSNWSNFDNYGFDNGVMPAATVMGLGNSKVSGGALNDWNMTQPFFNDGPLDFAGSTGAFTSGDWASPSVATWVKYSGF